jgi:ribosomal protein L16 Arg81 hydroxylase
MFVIDGRKRILGWPDAYMRRQKADPTYTLDYRRYRKDAIVLEGAPGDVLYFPSDYWHIVSKLASLRALTTRVS